MSKKTRYEMVFPGERLVRWLAVVITSLLCIHVILTVCHYRVVELPWLLRELFDVDEEESIPTWFSASLLLLVSATLCLIGRLERRDGDRYALYWFGLAAGFLFLSLDEIAGFHETLNTIIDISWAVPGLVIVAMVGIAFLRFLLALPSSVAARFLIAGAIYVGGAVGVELATEPYLYNDELDTLGYNLWTPVEEGMEMGGVLIFLATLLQYMKDNWTTTIIVAPSR